MRLIDAFAEIFSYTEFLIKKMQTDSESVDIEKVVTDYDSLLTEINEKFAEFIGLENAKFAVCAWVDERILCSGWQNAHKWVSYQLQRKVFNTTNAGEEFFVRLNSLTEEDKEVREVYAYCLSLGFSGRYFRHEDKDRLTGIRQDNFKSITQDGEVPEQLFPTSVCGHDHSDRKRHYGFTFAAVLGVIIPPAVFGVMYAFFYSSLNSIMKSYFGF